jgi:hypothetical protein
VAYFNTNVVSIFKQGVPSRTHKHAWERIMHIGFWWKRQKERDHYEDLDIGGRIKLSWI